MPKSPAARLGIFEKLDLYRNMAQASTGSVREMERIIHGAKMQGARDPLRYYQALVVVLEASNERGLEAIARDAIAATEFIEGELPKQGHVLAAMDAHKRLYAIRRGLAPL
jgi:hypothetical protein